MFPFPFLFLFQRVLCVTLNYIYNWAESRTTVNWQLLMVSVLAMLGIRKLLLTQAINMRRRQSVADVSRIRTVCRQYFQIINTVPIQHDQLTVAWAISMAMTRTPDQLIKITVLKLRQGACGMVHGACGEWRVERSKWQVQNWRASTCEATCECYTNYRQIMWQTRCVSRIFHNSSHVSETCHASNKRNWSGAGREGGDAALPPLQRRPSTSAA